MEYSKDELNAIVKRYTDETGILISAQHDTGIMQHFAGWLLKQNLQQANVSGSKKMQFISVAVRKPEKRNTYHVRWLEDGRPLILGACTWDGKKFDTMDEGIEGAQPDEWLDEGE